MKTPLDTITFPDFVEDAACRTESPELFFPPEGGGSGEAKKVCRRCDVAEACLTYALVFEAEHPGSRWGIYGGTTARERRTLTAKNRKKATA